MGSKMATIAILCLLLLERFLASDMDSFTEPVLVGLRALERSALRYKQNIISPDVLSRYKTFSKFYLFTPEATSEGIQLNSDDKSGFAYFQAERETKIVIHGFLDKAVIAHWMHHMKDEFLLLGDFNVIIVDWSLGNFIPYTQAAANTERVGEEISGLILYLMETYGALPSMFHLIGHSLGSHVAGYVGERIKGMKRITGLDPATHLFTNASPRSKLDRTDAEFVDIIHTDAGGIGIVESAGHVDFYPNGGEVQPGCTASNSLRSLLEKGVVEGARNLICSHMRAALLFTDTINGRHCEMVGHECSNNDEFTSGSCDSCGESGSQCATMGYHIDRTRDYGNGTKFFLLTAKKAPFCGYEYKLTFDFVSEGDRTWRNVLPNVFRRTRGQWSNSDVLHISVYGSSGSAEFELERKEKQTAPATYVVFNSVDLGIIHGAIAHWTKKPFVRSEGVVSAISKAITRDCSVPLISKMQVKPMKTTSRGRNIPMAFDLCANPALPVEKAQKGTAFRSEYC